MKSTGNKNFKKLREVVLKPPNGFKIKADVGFKPE